MQVRFTLIEHESDAYQQMLKLRTEVLLQPIGIDASYIKPEAEKTDKLLGAYDMDALIGCCVLTPRNKDAIQLRQMAIAKSLQGQGIGAALVQFAEQVAKENGYRTLMLHARSHVVSFYEKSGYVIIGASFEEVGIEHYCMEKLL